MKQQIDKKEEKPRFSVSFGGILLIDIQENVEDEHDSLISESSLSLSGACRPNLLYRDRMPP